MLSSSSKADSGIQKGTVIAGPSTQMDLLPSSHVDPSPPMSRNHESDLGGGSETGSVWETIWRLYFSTTMVSDVSAYTVHSERLVPLIQHLAQPPPPRPRPPPPPPPQRGQRGGVSSSSGPTDGQSTQQQYWERNIVFLGRGGVGKSSVIKTFTEAGPSFFFNSSAPKVSPTLGMENTDYLWEENQGGADATPASQRSQQQRRLPPLHLHLLDCSGELAYGPVQARYWTEHSIFVLVWDISQVELECRIPSLSLKEQIPLQGCLTELLGRFPRATLVLVATHMDQLRQQDRPVAEEILEKMEIRLSEFVGTVFKPVRGSSGTASPIPRPTGATTTTTTTNNNNNNSPAPRAAGGRGGVGGVSRVTADHPGSSSSSSLNASMVDVTGGSPFLIIGNFAGSCVSRHMVAGGAQRGLSPGQMDTVFQFLAKLARRQCLQDTRFSSAVLPPLYASLNTFIQEVKGAFPDRLLVSLRDIVCAGKCAKRSAAVANHQAVTERSPREEEEEDMVFGVELSGALRFLHDRGIIFWWSRYEPAARLTTEFLSRGFVMLDPGWMFRMVNAVFSFAHILATPRYLRSSIEHISYSITEAELADQLLFRKGYLRLPLARVLLQSVAMEMMHRCTDADVGMCLSLLVSLELAYPVEVFCEDPAVLAVEPAYPKTVPAAGQFVFPYSSASVKRGVVMGRVASPSTGGATTVTLPTTVSRSVMRFFIPSLAPRHCPSALFQVAPLLLHQGIRRRFVFNALPLGLWHRLQCRLHPYFRLVALHHPCPVSDLEAMEENLIFEKRLKEADDEHNRWHDAMWMEIPSSVVSSSLSVDESSRAKTTTEDEVEGPATSPSAQDRYRGLRAFLFRQGKYPCEVFLYTSQVDGSEVILNAVEQALFPLLAEFSGITLQSFTGCSNSGVCENWVQDLPAGVRGPGVGGEEEGAVPQWCRRCQSCLGATPSSEQVGEKSWQRPRGLHPQVLLQHQEGMRRLLKSTLSHNSCVDLSRVLGLQLYGRDGVGASPNSNAPSEENGAGSQEGLFGKMLDKVVEVALYDDWAARTRKT